MATYAEDWTSDLEWEDFRAHADPYPTLRAALSSEYAELAPESIEALVESMYADVSAEDLESFFKSLKRAAGSVGRVAQRALPGVIQGATTGAALGPWGALAGGIAGGALSAAKGARAPSAARRRARPQRSAGGARPSVPTRLPGRGALGQLAGSPAAAQLLRTLGRPEIGQALMSLAMGGAGKSNVKVGNVPIPTGAITTTLRRLLERAEAELHEHKAGEGGGPPLYLLDAAGEFIVDPTDEDERADWVLELLSLSDTENAAPGLESAGYGEDDDSWSFEYEFDEDQEADDEAVLLYEGVDFESLDDDGEST